MVVFSGEVISSYAVPKKPFWAPLEPETTMRCLGAMMQRIYRDQEKEEEIRKGVWEELCLECSPVELC